MRYAMIAALVFSLAGGAVLSFFPTSAEAQANCKAPRKPCAKNPHRCCN